MARSLETEPRDLLAPFRKDGDDGTKMNRAGDVVGDRSVRDDVKKLNADKTASSSGQVEAQSGSDTALIQIAGDTRFAIGGATGARLVDTAGRNAGSYTVLSSVEEISGIDVDFVRAASAPEAELEERIIELTDNIDGIDEQMLEQALEECEGDVERARELLLMISLRDVASRRQSTAANKLASAVRGGVNESWNRSGSSSTYRTTTFAGITVKTQPIVTPGFEIRRAHFSSPQPPTRIHTTQRDLARVRTLWSERVKRIAIGRMQERLDDRGFTLQAADTYKTPHAHKGRVTHEDGVKGRWSADLSTSDGPSFTLVLGAERGRDAERHMKTWSSNPIQVQLN